jgi:hypothetical protein
MAEYQSPKSDTDRWIVILIIGAGLLVALCLAAVVVVAAVLIFGMTFPVGVQPAVTVIAVTPLPATVASGSTPIPSPTPVKSTSPGADPTPDMLPDVSPDALDALEVELPPRDRYDLARRFLGIGEATPPPARTYRVGDIETFYVDNDDTETVVEVQAELVYIAEHAYMWVEEGIPYNYDDLVRSADRFSDETYPTNRAYFGSEASPGIDGDVRLHILHSVELGSWVAGYFYSPSEYPSSVVPYSNEKEIFFINIGNTPPGNDYYDGVLAHEFQHMIHWHVDQNEESWLNEGLSEVATFLNGLGPSGFTYSYLMDTDLQLTDWPEGGGAGSNYGAGFLFGAYFLDRFGQDALRTLAANPLNGMDGVDDTLQQLGAGVTAQDVFMDWSVANLVNDTRPAGGVYGYPSQPDLSPAWIQGSVSAYPADLGWTQVHQFGVDYIELLSPGDVTITFEGSQVVRILPTNTLDTDRDPATDDSYVWWSNRGDDSDMRLTRVVDLRGVSEAVLDYDVWYQIEDLWDYAYLTVSPDGGETWTILPTPHTTEENPHGNSYGPGYTGASRDQPGATPEGWLHESIDLSAYAGQEILLRFEMITDDAVNRPGLAIDNLCIDEIGWCDNAEEGVEDWIAEGFVRHNNVLPQVFGIQAVIPQAGGSVIVERLPLTADNTGSWTLAVPAGDPVVLVISGLTRFTTEPAQYHLSITGG